MMPVRGVVCAVATATRLLIARMTPSLMSTSTPARPRVPAADFVLERRSQES
jgi:hypothetical protein